MYGNFPDNLFGGMFYLFVVLFLVVIERIDIVRRIVGIYQLFIDGFVGIH